MANIEKRLQSPSDREVKRIEKEFKELQDKQHKELKKYGENFKRRFSSFLQNQQDAVQRIQQYQTELSGTKLKPPQRKSLQKKLCEVQSTIELGQDQLLQLARLFNQADDDPLKFLEQFEGDHRQIYKTARLLTELFTERAARQINLTRGDNFANAVLEIVRLTIWLEPPNSNEIGVARAQKLDLRPLLFETPEMLQRRSPGDSTESFAMSVVNCLPQMMRHK